MSLLNNIQSKHILVIGDVMLDTYYMGDVNRISPEAPVPVFRKKNERSVLGGAANVASNLVAASQKVSVMAVVGNDAVGIKLKTIFNQQGINTDLILSLERHTTEKTRFLASNNQQVLRLDVEDTEELSSFDCERMLMSLRKVIRSFDLILMSDYLKGLLTFEFTQGVIGIAQEYKVPVIIDVKDSKCEKYSGATLLKPNLKELHDLTGLSVDNDEQIIIASRELKNKCRVDYILTTCGERGMVLVGNNEPYFIPAVAHEVFDVTGAGDTTIAYLGACMVNGMSMKEAVDIANFAASIQVAKVGTSSVYWSEIRECMMEFAGDSVHKIISGKIVEKFREEHKHQTIVFTYGIFDLLHVGHLKVLKEASKLGDMLIIGLNSDDSVKKLKGNKRTINGVRERLEVLSVLPFVDYIVIFDEDTPLNIINIIKPDVLVKGEDCSSKSIVGKNEVEQYGGKVVIVPMEDGISTTSIIERIKSLVV